MFMTEEKNILSFPNSAPRNGITSENRGQGRLEVAYPLPEYIAAWKIFRSFSNEDETIARHIISLVQKRFPGCRVPDERGNDCGLRILDIGPGDGRVLLQLLLQIPAKPSSLTFVEPNPEFMRQAQSNICFFGFADSINPIQSKALNVDEKIVGSCDVTLCTHTAYFLESDEMERLLRLTRPGAVLYVVLDDRTSLFSSIWKRTAPKYYDVAERHRRSLLALDPSVFSVNSTVIATKVKSPFSIRPDLAEMLMSLLSYYDVRDMESSEFEFVKKEITSATVGDHIDCKSTCFEICRY